MTNPSSTTVRLPALADRRINRGTDVLIGGKNVLICGYGDVGKAARSR
ncbi:S-adenosyl-L-homocysteine hydrolase, NAD binding domain protein [Mycobacterium xenopi 3993]|nr:S-adenosyl-L-homocysteine hydrolase, NAD binding domain protein [Mycobacterium xenopi 3993]